jgi:two-component system LytT family response regulator
METMHVNYTGYADEAKTHLVVLSTCTGIMIIPVQQIIRIQSISNYSKLFFKDACPATGGRKTLVVAKVLRWFQEQTCFFSFVRIHRTHFVNINYIKSYSDGKIGLLLLHNGEKLSIARRKKAVVTERVKSINRSFAYKAAFTSSFNSKKIIAA